MKQKFGDIFFKLLGITIIILVWEITFLNQNKETYLIPNPISTFQKLFQFFLSGVIFRDIIETLSRMFIGYFVACLLGVISGLFLGSFIILRKIFDGIIDFFRSIPVTALYPIFVLILGVGSISKIAMIFWASFFIVCINTIYGVLQTNPTRRNMAKLYGANWFQIFTQVTFYDSLPQTIVGLRIAISYALIVSILTEMFMGSQYGLGQKITESYNLYQIDSMFAIILITGVLGYLLNVIFVNIEKKIIGWKLYAN